MGEMRCDELVELVTDYLEEALGEEEASRVNAHLAGCDGCDNYVAQVRATIRTLGNQPKELPSTELDGKLLAIFHDWAAGRTEG